MVDYLVHFVNGALSGMVGILMSHPIDTIKSNVQTRKLVPRTIRGLYQGVNPALAGMAFEKSVVFGTYENSRRFFDKYSSQSTSVALSGAVSGIVVSPIVAPTERLKILAQTGTGFDIKYITQWRHHGLFRGLLATYTREVPGFTIYFSTYEYLKRRTQQRNSRSIRPWESAAYGGMSGALAWACICPQDVIKTHQQAATTNNHLGFIRTARLIYSQGGSLAFYRGFQWALIRAVPLHAGTFATMEALKKWSSVD